MNLHPVIPQDLFPTASPTFDGIQFGLTPTQVPSEGLMCWNPEDGTLNLGMPGDNVSLQIGQELLLRVRNTSGSLITNGSAVKISGSTGQHPEIDLADAVNHRSATSTIAVATEDIDINNFGYVTAFGLVRDMDTSGIAAGQPAFLSETPGEIQGFPTPTQPSSQVFIGVVIKSDATEGILFVKIIPQPNIDELSDVLVSSVVDLDILKWDNGNSVWVNESQGIRKIQTVSNTNLTLDGTQHTVLMDAATVEVDITLDLNPAQGQVYNIKCIDGTKACTILRNGNNIDGAANDFTVLLKENYQFHYDSTYGWAVL